MTYTLLGDKMKDIPDPLMFIHTVTTKKDGKVQDYYDSQEPHENKITFTPPEEKRELGVQPEENPPSLDQPVVEQDLTLESPVPVQDMLDIKINNIIRMYNNNRPVDCIVITDHETECTPYALENDELIVKINEEESRVKLSDIRDIYIVRF
jgi:hypothetical protein